MKTIRIACEGTLVPLSELKVIQGDLKTLTKKRYEKLRRAIEQDGFSFPISGWKDETGSTCILDGTQRYRTVLKMIEDGAMCSALPVSYTEAANLEEASVKLLHAASEYGRADRDGLYEFTQRIGLKTEQLQEVALAGLDIDSFADGYEQEPPTDSEAELCITCGRKMPTKG